MFATVLRHGAHVSAADPISAAESLPPTPGVPGTVGSVGATGVARATTSPLPHAGRPPLILAHHVDGARPPLFPAVRVMNTVTYLGRVVGNDVVLPSEKVSRRHAKLVTRDGSVELHDLDSHNGVFVNGKKVRSATLVPGDLIYVGDVCIELRMEPSQGVPADVTGSFNALPHSDISGEDDQGTRNLNAVARALRIALAEPSARYLLELVDLARELTEASVAVLLMKPPAGGAMQAAVLLQPGSATREEPPVSNAVVDEVLRTGMPWFAVDIAQRRTGLVGQSGAYDVGAVIAVPIPPAGGDSAPDLASPPVGVLYLGRPGPGAVFTERELPVVETIARTIALGHAARSAAARPLVLLESAAPAVHEANAVAAEQRAARAEAENRELATRIHTLEAAVLQHKHAVEIEQRAAGEARRDAEHARVEASKLEDSVKRHTEDMQRARELLSVSEQERAQLRAAAASLEEERRNRSLDGERTSTQLQQLTVEREAARADAEAQRQRLVAAMIDLQRLSGEAEAAQGAAAALDDMRGALRALVPSVVTQHVERVAAGEGARLSNGRRDVAVLAIAVPGLDPWATRGGIPAVEATLDAFCGALALRARANGGQLVDTLGAPKVVVFPGDAAGVRSALRCAIEVTAMLEDALAPSTSGDGPPRGVLCAVHVGSSVGGFFGEADAAVLVEAGEPLHVARSLLDLSVEPSGMLVTEQVRTLVADDAAFPLHLWRVVAIRGIATPLSVFRGAKPPDLDGRETAVHPGARQ